MSQVNQTTFNEVSGAALTASPGSMDYFEVIRHKGNKRYSFMCHVKARDQSHALQIARANGYRMPRGSYARRIGKEGYFAALRGAFPFLKSNPELCNEGEAATNED